MADSCSHHPSAVTQHLASFPKTASEHVWNSHKPSFIPLATCSSSGMTVSYAIPLSVCSSSSRTQSQLLVTRPEQPTEISFDFSGGNPRWPEAATGFVIIPTPHKLLFSYTQGLSQDSLSEILHRNLGLR